MSVSEKLIQLNQIKQDIKAAIIAKGGSAGDDMTTYAQAIRNLPQKGYSLYLSVQGEQYFSQSYFNFLITYADGTTEAASITIGLYGDSDPIERNNVKSYKLTNKYIPVSISSSNSSFESSGQLISGSYVRSASATSDFVDMTTNSSRIIITDVRLVADLERGQN